MVLANTVTKPTYEIDRRLENKFANTIKQILGMYFFVKDIEQDLKQGTDFLTFTISRFKVGARLRRLEFYLRYPDEFTIRWERPSGVKTEIQKIREGLVDYIFYGFIDAKEKKIIKYFIGDLDVFRRVNPKPISIKENKTKDSKLAAFKISQFPRDFILKEVENEEYKAIREITKKMCLYCNGGY